MTARTLRAFVVAVGLLGLFPGPSVGWANAPASESRRMSRAKDLIADEQWARAIEELRAAIADRQETSKAEALFWLAHSLNQDNDFAAAVDAIRRLEREHASSPWVKPARSLLIELAQKLKRADVLWWTAVRPPVPPATVAPAAATPRPAPRATPAPPRAHAPRAQAPRASDGPTRVEQVAPAPAVPTTPPAAWVAESWSPDTDQRILALRSLLHTDADKVIPMLRSIAMEEENPGAARRAVFVLVQSRMPEALSTVVEVAKKGPEPVRVAAVRGLGNFGGPEVSQALFQVYSTANALVKRQVLKTLGERAEAPALLRIAKTEADRSLRATAIVTLGHAGGREQLASLYSKADRESKRAIIVGLFTARAEEELIRIAGKETDSQLRAEVLRRLRLLGTPTARAFLAKVSR